MDLQAEKRREILKEKAKNPHPYLSQLAQTKLREFDQKTMDEGGGSIITKVTR